MKSIIKNGVGVVWPIPAWPADFDRRLSGLELNPNSERGDQHEVKPSPALEPGDPRMICLAISWRRQRRHNLLPISVLQLPTASHVPLRGRYYAVC